MRGARLGSPSTPSREGSAVTSQDTSWSRGILKYVEPSEERLASDLGFGLPIMCHGSSTARTALLFNPLALSQTK